MSRLGDVWVVVWGGWVCVAVGLMPTHTCSRPHSLTRPHRQVSGTVQAPNPRGFLEMELFRLFDHILNPPLAPVGKDVAWLLAQCTHRRLRLPTPSLTNTDPNATPPSTGGSKSSKNRRSSSHASSSSSRERERDRNRNRNHSSAGGGGGGDSATKKMPPPPAPVPPSTALPRLAADASVASLGGESAVSQMTEASYAAGGGEGGVKPPPRLRKASSRLVATIDERGPERLSGAICFWGGVGWMDGWMDGCVSSVHHILSTVLNHPLPQQPPVPHHPGVMLRCYELNKRLLNHPAGLYFREPVDPVRHVCENYFDVIKVGGCFVCVGGRECVVSTTGRSVGRSIRSDPVLTCTHPYTLHHNPHRTRWTWAPSSDWWRRARSARPRSTPRRYVHASVLSALGPPHETNQPSARAPSTCTTPQTPTPQQPNQTQPQTRSVSSSPTPWSITPRRSTPCGSRPRR